MLLLRTQVLRALLLCAHLLPHHHHEHVVLLLRMLLRALLLRTLLLHQQGMHDMLRELRSRGRWLLSPVRGCGGRGRRVHGA